ncbi:MAG: hypothetical protein RUDDFDWM_001159 [Candidatus Fervidibacterota bacterium]
MHRQVLNVTRKIVPCIIACFACAMMCVKNPVRASHNPHTDRYETLLKAIQAASIDDWELKAIMDALIEASNAGEIRCRVLVTDAPFANAIALPTGDVLITEGMLSLLHTTDEIAFVLAHELAHILRGDAQCLQRLYGQGLNQLPIEPALDKTLITEGLNILATLARSIYSQELECSADEIAVKLMADAGFDTRAALDVLERLSQSGSAHQTVWAITHPSVEQRLQRLSSMQLPKPKTLFKPTPPKDIVELSFDLDVRLPWCDSAYANTLEAEFKKRLNGYLQKFFSGVKLARAWQKRRTLNCLVSVWLASHSEEEMKGMDGWLLLKHSLKAIVVKTPEQLCLKSDEREFVSAMRSNEGIKDVMRWRLNGIAEWLARLSCSAIQEILGAKL